MVQLSLFTQRDGFNLNTAYFPKFFVFAVCGATISYLIGPVVKNATVIPACLQCYTLGLSFVTVFSQPMNY